MLKVNYSKEEKLILFRPVWITKEEFKILRKEKEKQGISMAKIICNLIRENYGNTTRSKTVR